MDEDIIILSDDDDGGVVNLDSDNLPSSSKFPLSTTDSKDSSQESGPLYENEDDLEYGQQMEKILIKGEKERRKVEREISASVKSKCEKYTFCHISSSVFDKIANLENCTRDLFDSRGIKDQMVVVNCPEKRIEWYRKRIAIQKELGADVMERLEYTVKQNIFGIVIDAAKLNELISHKKLCDFISEERAKFRSSFNFSPMVVVHFGEFEIPKKKVYQLNISLYEKHKTQLFEAKNNQSFALYLCQISRSISRFEKKQMEKKTDENSTVSYSHRGKKGKNTKNRDELVKDWWNKMLAVVDRMSDAQRRAITEFLPDPVVACKKYSEMDVNNAVNELANIKLENGNRLGEVMAKRVIMMLTDKEIV